MHITIIANNFTDDYIYNLLNNLDGKVDKIDFIGSRYYKSEKINPNINFFVLRKNHENNVPSYIKLIQIIDYYYSLLKHIVTSPSKVVHVQWLRFNFVEGVLIAGFMRLMKKKVIYTAHNVMPHDTKGIYNKILFNFIYKIQTEIIVHTSHIKNQLVDIFKLDPKKVHVVHHGVYQIEKNPLITKAAARNHLEISPSSKVILFFGKIAAYKGLDVLVDSVNLLPKEVSLEVLIAGRVMPAYQKEFDRLISLNRKTKFHFLLKFLDQEEIEYVFKASDVTVLPYKEASQSGVLFMSYSYGKPVIAPNFGGFPEDVIKKTGYIFEANDPKSLADTLTLFEQEWMNASDKEEQFIMDYAVKNYSWDAACMKLVEVYRKVKARDISSKQQLNRISSYF